MTSSQKVFIFILFWFGLMPAVAFAAPARTASLVPTTFSSVSSGNVSFDTNGANVLFVYSYEENTDNIAISYAGSAMTQAVATSLCYSAGGNTHRLKGWYITSPASGANNISWTSASSPSHVEISALAYSGGDTASQPDSTSSGLSGSLGSCGSGASSLSVNNTTINNDAIITGFARFDNGGSVTGSGAFTKVWQGSSGEPGIEATFDTSPINPAASTAVGFTGANGGSAIAMVVMAVKPSTGSPVYGCTDPLAVNYDPAADTDDGSCTYGGGGGGGGSLPDSTFSLTFDSNWQDIVGFSPQDGLSWLQYNVLQLWVFSFLSFIQNGHNFLIAIFALVSILAVPFLALRIFYRMNY